MNENIGILDPNGKNNNPLNNKPYSDKYKKLAQVWSKLPAYKKAHDIIDKIKENQVILTIFETGAGKTVLNPKFALHAYNYDAKIAITLPKRIITKSAAEYAALTLDVELGEEVGYQYKGSPSNAKSDKTKLLYATDGTIVARLLKDPQLNEFNAVIIDEAHDRKVQIDFLLYLLRETLKIRPDFKIIIMSATINAELFANYFKDFKFAKIEVPGARTFPIESIFLEESMNYNKILEKGFEILIQIMKNDDPTTKSAHDIIFFVTSSNEAFKICQMLNDHIKKEKQSKCDISCKGDVFCIEVYAGMHPEKQTLAQDKEKYKNGKYIRKVVISTNVAESSLTIDGVRYVIDSGYELKGSYDPILRARKLERSLITQAQAKQRMGRAGRTEPGICYHMYTKEEFDNKMIKFPEPEIRINDITSECLKLLVNDNIGTVEKLINIFTSFIEPPKEDFIRTSVDVLEHIRVLKDNKITDYGKFLNEIPEDDLFMANSIVFGKLYNCSREITKINTMIAACRGNISDLYSIPSKDNEKLMEKFKKEKSKFSHKYGDHLSLLKIFDDMMENKDKLYDWCYKNFFKINTFVKISEEYKKKKEKINRINISKETFENFGFKYFEKINQLDVPERVLACIIMGFQMNTAIVHNSAYHTKFYKGNNIKINKMSFLHGKDKLPKNVVYYELFVSMGRMDLSIVSKIPNKIVKTLAN
ncbi:HrpA-like RNA helicase [Indivirus ILV1]|uniref:HrpA-like RNA helicase n=1 Tax=Indivirus ILV1 TaxID=1977633 RepID=A0A1V0SDF7_9VIRU|nr:HrpA-like RNA helicase [Indivirus ILV1]